MTVELLAMTPAGETLIVRDPDGYVWVQRPDGAGGTAPFDPALLDAAVAEHGLDRIERQFPSWDELERFRQARAAAVTPQTIVDVERLELEDVERLIAGAERWRAEGEGARARRLALRLLRVPAVLDDEPTHERLLRFVERLDDAPLELRLRAATPRHAAARERWHALAA